MGTDVEAIGQHIAQEAVRALACLSPRDQAAIARQLTRLCKLEDEHRAIVRDVLDRLTMSVRDSLPPDAARIVTTLEAGLAILREEKGTRA